MRDYRSHRLRLGARAYSMLSMSLENESQPILALVRDLMFASKISATAKSLGISVKFIRDPDLLHNETGSRLILDLNQAGTLEAAVKWKQTHSDPIIGFVSHVDSDMTSRAKAAGIQVVSRGEFTRNIGILLAHPSRCVDRDELA